MDRFVSHRGVVAPYLLDNVDTDQIMPKQFLTRIERTGFGRFIFNDLRYNPDGSPVADFVLNQPEYRSAKILLAGANFGCGSSREHAPWGLLDFGFRVIIAASFADIFYNNCFKIGILPVTLAPDQITQLSVNCESHPGYKAEVDLEFQKAAGEFGFEADFELDPFRKHCLFNGLDDIGLTLEDESKILEFEKRMIPTAV
jgi:3-isopropylmalate/(R)-2-methylmalate dehydratase small subunit